MVKPTKPSKKPLSSKKTKGRKRTTGEKVSDFIADSTIPLAYTIAAGMDDPKQKVIDVYKRGKEVAADRRKKLDKERGTVSRKTGGSVAKKKQSGHNRLY